MATRKQLPSGRTVELGELDPYTLATTNVAIPNTALHDVFTLLTGGTFSLDTDAQNENDAGFIRGVYEVCSLWMVKPKLVLRGKAKNGDLRPGIGGLSWGDALALYNLFRIGDGSGMDAPAGDEPGQDAGTASAGDEVPVAAE